MVNGNSLPGGWNILSLEDCVDILDNQRIPINASDREERNVGKGESELYPYYGATGKVGMIDGFIFDGEFVLLGEDGAPFLDASKDKAYIIRGKSWVNNHAHVLIAKDNHTNNLYLMHYLNFFDYHGYVTGTTRLKLNQSQMRRFPIILPPLTEQEHIVAKIEELFTQLDAGTAALKRVQAGLKRYKASVLKAACEGRLVPQNRSDEPAEEMLRRMGRKPLEGDDLPPLPEGWCWVKIGDIADINIRDFSIRNLLDDTLVTFVPMAAVDAEQGLITKPKVRFLKEVRKGFTQFSEGDVIFAKITPCMENGKVAIAQNLENGVGFGSTEFHVLSSTEIVETKWLYYFVRQEIFRKEAKLNFKGTAGQLRVPASFLNDHSIPLPPLEEQRRIIPEIEHHFSIMHELDHTISGNLQRSALLRQAILKRAFEGRLTAPIDQLQEEVVENMRAAREIEKKVIPTQERLF